jgi:hypothetical protein
MNDLDVLYTALFDIMRYVRSPLALLKKGGTKKVPRIALDLGGSRCTA